MLCGMILKYSFPRLCPQGRGYCVCIRRQFYVSHAQTLLENRFFIRNNRLLLDLIFRIYRRHLFFCGEKSCGRLFVAGRKK
jgi:hypothetical protein